MSKTVPLGLVGDIGATNARFALADREAVRSEPRLYKLEQFASLEDVLDAFVRDEGAKPREAVLAIAAPVTGDRVSMTNHDLSFSIEALRARYAFDRLKVINDFAANAMAIPHLSAGDVHQIGGGEANRDAPIAVIGPGTGLGVSALVPCDQGHATPIQGEGGHATMSAHDDEEAAILAHVRKRFGHASAERVLSGAGLVNLYTALCERAGATPAALKPSDVTNPESADPHARAATQIFCAMLGAAAGNVALTLGARGGVYVAGGIAPRLGDVFIQSQFRARFEAKGRFRNYLSVIPTLLITRELPALLGAAKLLSA